MAKKARQPRVAPAQDVIIRAIAADCPARLHDSASLLRSETLQTQGLSAIKKSLARARNGALREVLLLNQNDPRVLLPEIGMVAVTVSLASLNAERTAWVEGHGGEWLKAQRKWRETRKGSPPTSQSPEPTQELILLRIIDNAKAWIEAERAETIREGLGLLVLDASIVHGSSSFDMLVTVLYRQLSFFTRFVREVIQRTSHVDSTQTLQVPFRIGLPNLES